MFKRRRYPGSIVVGRLLDAQQQYRIGSLLNAVHNAITVQSVKLAKRGGTGTDQLFRHPVSSVAISPHRAENPRQAETCIFLQAWVYDDVEDSRPLPLRTFRFRPTRYDHQPATVFDSALTDCLHLTVGQVLRATMAQRPHASIPIPLSDMAHAEALPPLKAPIEAQTVNIGECGWPNILDVAIRDYKQCYIQPTSSRRPIIATPSNNPPMFVEAGCRGAPSHSSTSAQFSGPELQVGMCQVPVDQSLTS
jgi:hypothetical protein